MKKNLDKQLWGYTIAIIVLGLVALYSASYEKCSCFSKSFL